MEIAKLIFMVGVGDPVGINLEKEGGTRLRAFFLL